MKNEFWKEGLLRVVLFVIAPVIPFALTVAACAMTARDSGYWAMILAGSILLIASLLPIFFLKEAFSKIIVSDTGITQKWRNKEINSIEWNSVTDVKLFVVGKSIYGLSFLEGDKSVDVVINQKMYNAVMDSCSNSDILYVIENIPQLEFYKKKRIKERRER